MRRQSIDNLKFTSRLSDRAWGVRFEGCALWAEMKQGIHASIRTLIGEASMLSGA